MKIDPETFVAALEDRGATFDWLPAPNIGDFYLNLDRVDIDEEEEVSIRYALCDHYDGVRAHLLTRETKH